MFSSRPCCATPSPLPPPPRWGGGPPRLQQPSGADESIPEKRQRAPLGLNFSRAHYSSRKFSHNSDWRNDTYAEQLTSSAAGPAALRLPPSPTTKVRRDAAFIALAQRSGRIDSGKAAAGAFGAEFLPHSLIIPGNSATTAIGGTIRTRSN